MSDPEPLLDLRAVTKSFPGVRALDGVDFRLYGGEIHALLGENGAGKSTLIKVMTGVYRRDGGEIRLDGDAIDPASPAEAQDLGISTVYQEVNLVPTLSVTANLTLERQPGRFGLVSWRRAHAHARALLARLGIEIDVTRPLGSYSIALQQMVAIARALDRDARVLVLDEPTASLDAREVEVLFAALRDLRARGIAIVFVTHFLDQVYAVSDRITVLRNGKLVGSFETPALSRVQLISHMLGKELAAVERHARPDGDAPERVPFLAAEGVGRKRWLEPIDLEIARGEILGLAGLLGSGRTEAVKLLFGAVRADAGRITVDGRPVAIRSPRHAIRLGFGFCPEDRKSEGIVPALTVRENIVLALQARRGWHRPLPRAEQERLAARMIKALAIATPDAEKPVGQLSGGNQQKVILARWLVSEPRLLILDEPTRGIDVGAHAEIVALIRRLCADGLALLVVSSELDEIVAFSDRVAVMRDRRKVAELTGAGISEHSIIQAIASQ